MNNTYPQIVLNLTSLTGISRGAVSKIAQQRLFELGYFWNNNTPKTPYMTDANYLFICSLGNKKQHITWCSTYGPIVRGQDDVMFYASSQLDAFLENAAQAMSREMDIDGVKVTITPTDIKLDPSDLLKLVTEKARAIQAEDFGS